MGQATIFAGQKIKTLKDALSLNGQSDIISRDVNPQTSAVDAKAGSLLLNPTSGIMYRKLDAGSTTNWVEVGAGTGGKNYIKNPDFDGGATTSWSMQKVSLSSFIPTGNIGAADAGHTIATSSSSPLEGAYSLLVAGSAAFTAGNCLVSAAFTIDREDVAKVMGWSFSYEAITTNMDFSGTTANTWAVYIAEVTTATPNTVVSWIQPAGVYNLVQGSGVGLASGTFQTTATESSAYRIVLVCINSEAAATTLKVDDFQLGPQRVVYGSPITDWVSYNPTISPISGYTTAPSGRYRRVGDSYEVYISFRKDGSAGTGATALTFSLPFTVDTSKIFTGDVVNSLGWAATFGVLGASQYDRLLNIELSGTNALQIAKPASSSVYVGTDVPASSYFTVHAILPAAGLSSSVSMSNDSDTRVVAAVANGNPTNTLSGSPTTMNCGSKVYDTHGAYNATTGAYVVPVSGYYLCSANTEIAGTEATDANITIVLYSNNSPTTVNGASRIQNSGLSTSFCYASGLIYVNAGQTLDFRVSTSIGSPSYAASTTGTSISFQRISGPATIAASETVAASAYRSIADGAQSITTSAGQTFRYFTEYYPTKLVDTHGMITTSASDTYITIPVSGVYEIIKTCRYIEATATNTVQSYIVIGGTNQTNTVASDGTIVSIVISSVTTGNGNSITNSYMGSFNAGDIVRFKLIKYNDTTFQLIQNYNSQFSIKRIK